MKDLQKLIDKVIDKAVIGCDTYKHNGSTWLLFTNDKKWVIELTKEGTLWYNYYFFQKLFKVIALDVVENQHYITKWVEDTVINGVKSTKGEYYKEIQKVEYTIENGVKYTIDIEDAIQNGVKKTRRNGDSMNTEAEDVIQNGVKDTSNRRLVVSKEIEDTIQNGVKRTLQKNINRIGQVEDAIKNGVRETKLGAPDNRDYFIEDTIQNGVKRTDFNIYIANNRVEDTIQNGVKKTYSDKIPHEYDWSNQFTEEIDDIIQNGVKHTRKSLQIDYSCVIEDVIKEGVIEHGIKETKSEVATREWKAGEVINGGVKKTTPGGYLGSVERKGKMVHQFEHSKQDDNVEDVIKSGIKATTTNLPLSQDDGQIAEIEDVIKNGVKECIPSRTPLYNPMDFSVQYRENHRLDDVASVLEKGIKEVQPLPAQDGNMDYSNYYYTQGDRTKPHTKYVDDVITNGIKKTKAMDEWVNTDRILDCVTNNGIKDKARFQLPKES
jgi:hypothetical protein